MQGNFCTRLFQIFGASRTDRNAASFLCEGQGASLAKSLACSCDHGDTVFQFKIHALLINKKMTSDKPSGSSLVIGHLQIAMDRT
jgi:hypothetical protein